MRPSGGWNDLAETGKGMREVGDIFARRRIPQPHDAFAAQSGHPVAVDECQLDAVGDLFRAAAEFAGRHVPTLEGTAELGSELAPVRAERCQHRAFISA